MTEAELEFREFFAAEYGRLRGLGYLLTSDWAEAEELAQDALVRTYRVWPRVRRHERPGAYARKVLLNRPLLERPSPGGASRHASRVIAAGTARWSHPQVRISGRGGQLPGIYQGRRGPRPLRGTVNGPGAVSCSPSSSVRGGRRP